MQCSRRRHAVDGGFIIEYQNPLVYKELLAINKKGNNRQQKNSLRTGMYDSQDEKLKHGV